MRISNVFLTITLLTGFSIVTPCIAKSTVQTENTYQSIILNVQNMTCALCKITIRKALERVKGVQSAKVDFNDKTASILFNPQKTSIKILVEAITNSGYPATIRSEK